MRQRDMCVRARKETRHERSNPVDDAEQIHVEHRRHMDHLSGCVAVITGAASGVGLGLAREFAGRGMSVVLADLPGDRLDRAADKLAGAGGDVYSHGVDVTDAASVDVLAVGAEARYGAIDLVCLNAGILGPTNIPMWEIDDTDWRANADTEPNPHAGSPV
jgi:NAD(P)-dependent dehydrogenase (short-subunit alcohol dehydrogenase family)